MATSIQIPKIRTECIPYIEGCGWKFFNYREGSYYFRGVNGRKTMSGNDTISFTMNELRHAFTYGW
jgi:hypothetical protein